MLKSSFALCTIMSSLGLLASAKAAFEPIFPKLPLEREGRFNEVFTATILPWFDGQTDQWLDGTAGEEGPVRLRYRAFIQPEHTANMIIVHGFGERIEKYRELAFDFHQQGYNVFLYDQRGFGLSSRLSQANAGDHVDRFDFYAWDLQKILTRVVAKQAADKPNFIYAHSMGAAVTLLMIDQSPDLVAALVLSAPMLEINSYGFPHWLLKALAVSARALGFGKDLVLPAQFSAKPEFALAATQSRERWQSFVDFAYSPDEVAHLTGSASIGWVAEALKANSKLDRKEFARSISVPILLFQAEDDRYVASGGQNRFAEVAPKCQQIFVPGSRHEIYLEQDSIRIPYLQHVARFFHKERQDILRMKIARP